MSAEIAVPCVYAACSVNDIVNQERWLPIVPEGPRRTLVKRCPELAKESATQPPP